MIRAAGEEDELGVGEGDEHAAEEVDEHAPQRGERQRGREVRRDAERS